MPRTRTATSTGVARTAVARVVAPFVWTAAVLWLASPAAEWSSGTILDLNGASHLRG